MSKICDICEELEVGFGGTCCNVCFAKMCAIIECKTPEQAEELLKSFYKYPTAKSALLNK